MLGNVRVVECANIKAVRGAGNSCSSSLTADPLSNRSTPSSGDSMVPSVGSTNSDIWTENMQCPPSWIDKQPWKPHCGNTRANCMLNGNQPAQTLPCDHRKPNITTPTIGSHSFHKYNNYTRPMPCDQWINEQDNLPLCQQTQLIRESDEGEKKTIWIYSYKNAEFFENNTSSDESSATFTHRSDGDNYKDSPRNPSTSLYVPTLNLESQSILETVPEVVEPEKSPKIENKNKPSKMMKSVTRWIDSSVREVGTQTSEDDKSVRSDIGRKKDEIEIRNTDSYTIQPVRLNPETNFFSGIVEVEDKHVNTEISADHNIETVILIPKKNFIIRPWENSYLSTGNLNSTESIKTGRLGNIVSKCIFKCINWCK